MKFQAKITEADRVEAPLDDFQSRKFFSHEKHRFALKEDRGNQVSDRLRLPGARRSLDNEDLYPLAHQ